MTSAYCTSTEWGLREGGEDEAEGEQAESLAGGEAGEIVGIPQMNYRIFDGVRDDQENTDQPTRDYLSRLGMPRLSIDEHGSKAAS